VVGDERGGIRGFDVKHKMTEMTKMTFYKPKGLTPDEIRIVEGGMAGLA